MTVNLSSIGKTMYPFIGLYWNALRAPFQIFLAIAFERLRIYLVDTLFQNFLNMHLNWWFEWKNNYSVLKIKNQICRRYDLKKWGIRGKNNQVSSNKLHKQQSNRNRLINFKAHLWDSSGIRKKRSDMWFWCFESILNFW